MDWRVAAGGLLRPGCIDEDRQRYGVVALSPDVGGGKGWAGVEPDAELRGIDRLHSKMIHGQDEYRDLLQIGVDVECLDRRWCSGRG
jgi:hypothetical protein